MYSTVHVADVVHSHFLVLCVTKVKQVLRYLSQINYYYIP